jgi:hypothetical protein
MAIAMPGLAKKPMAAAALTTAFAPANDRQPQSIQLVNQVLRKLS